MKSLPPASFHKKNICIKTPYIEPPISTSGDLQLLDVKVHLLFNSFYVSVTFLCFDFFSLFWKVLGLYGTHILSLRKNILPKQKENGMPKRICMNVLVHAHTSKENMSNNHLSQNPSNQPINVASMITYDKCMFFTWKIYQYTREDKLLSGFWSKRNFRSQI